MSTPIGEVLIAVRESTRSGCLSAAPWPTIPPREKPATWAAVIL